MSSELKTLLALLFTWSYFYCFAQEQSFDAIEKSLFQKLESTKNVQDSIDVYNDISFNYRRIDPKKMMEYADVAIQLGQSIGYTKGLAYAHKNKGIAYYKLGLKRDSIIFFYEQAIDYAERVDDYYTVVACRNNIGLVQADNLEYDLAIGNYLGVVLLIDSLKLDAAFIKALALGNTGMAYQKKEDHLRAIDYFNDALDIANQNDNKVITSIYLDEMATSYLDIGNEKKALSIIEEVLEIHNELKDYQSKVETLLRYTKIELKRENVKIALDYALEAYDLSRNYNISILHNETLIALAQCYLELEDIEQAEKFANLAHENLKEETPYTEKLNTFQILNDISLAKKDYATAHQYLGKTKEIQELMYNEQAAIRSRRMNADYENNQKLIKIKELESERASQKRWINSLIVFLCSSAALFVLIFFLYQRRNKLVKELNQKNKEITIQSEELQELSQLKDKLFSTISHDLKSPIANFEQGLKYLLSGELTQKEFLSYSTNLKEDATQLRKSVDELMNWSYMKMVGLEPQATSVNVYEAVEQIIQANRQTGQSKKLTFSNKLSTDLFVSADQEHLNSILRNLTSNAIKFSYEGRTVTFSAHQKKDHIIISVEDEGVGIEKERQKDIFRAGSTTWGTEGEKGTGLGLALCKEFVEQNGGEIWVVSKVGSGSTFFVTFPTNTFKTQSPALSNAVL